MATLLLLAWLSSATTGWLDSYYVLLLALALLEWILRTTPNIVKEWKGRTFGCTSSFMASLGTNNADYVVGR